MQGTQILLLPNKAPPILLLCDFKSLWQQDDLMDAANLNWVLDRWIAMGVCSFAIQKIDPLLLDHVWIWGGRWHATCCWSYLVFSPPLQMMKKITLLEETLLTMYSCCIVRSYLRTIIILPSEEPNGKARLSHRTAVRLTTWQRAYELPFHRLRNQLEIGLEKTPLIIDGSTFGQKSPTPPNEKGLLKWSQPLKMFLKPRWLRVDQY